MRSNKANRSGFYIVILCMLFISVSLLMYAEGRAAFDDEIDGANSLDYEGFIAIEISDISSGAEAFMRSFLPVTNMAYAEQIDNKTLETPGILEMEALLLPDDSFFGAIVLSTLDDGTALPNDVTISDLELPDDDLILSEKTTSWKEHVVQQKETLSDIAMKFSGITVQDIVRANELKDPNHLKEKQILLVPLKEEFVADTLEEVRTRKARVAALKEAIIPLEVKSYTVQDGDSLWSIANSMNLEVDTLIGSNTLGNVLRPNVVLRVPNQDGIFHKFKTGDTAINHFLPRIDMNAVESANLTVFIHNFKHHRRHRAGSRRPAIASDLPLPPLRPVDVCLIVI
ncbi:MAG: LysM peptidoglycan-binding domain-containing protein [Synergistaceae bacterium]|nr:LysM peptidoglycan-binding domain-containing protein [Synergistaceae bacterium]